VYPQDDCGTDHLLDGKDWIKCSNCDKKWNHTECELGQNQLNPEDEDIRLACEGNDEDQAYYCVKCRKMKKVKQLRQQNRARISSVQVEARGDL
jgi:hypothetical protein